MITTIAISFITNLVIVYVLFYVLEAMREFRCCVKRNTSGGYYQKFSLAQKLGARYLINKREVRCEKLPQGGYNLYPYQRPTLLFPGDNEAV